MSVLSFGGDGGDQGSGGISAANFAERGDGGFSGHSGEPLLPTTFVDYDEYPREYHLNTIQTVLHTHTRVTDLYSNKIVQLKAPVTRG